MKTIWKFPVGFDPIEIPTGFKVLHVATQDESPCIWAEVDTDARRIKVQFLIIGTGHEIPPYTVYVGTFQLPPFMWHVFSKLA